MMIYFKDFVVLTKITLHEREQNAAENIKTVKIQYQSLGTIKYFFRINLVTMVSIGHMSLHPAHLKLW